MPHPKSAKRLAAWWCPWCEKEFPPFRECNCEPCGGWRESALGLPLWASVRCVIVHVVLRVGPCRREVPVERKPEHARFCENRRGKGVRARKFRARMARGAFAEVDGVALCPPSGERR